MMLDPNDFDLDPRDYALQLIEDGRVSFRTLAVVLIKAMSHDAVREALDANELSPRFLEDEDYDGEDYEEDENETPINGEAVINLLKEPND
jgi:hypothetical protein